MSFFLVIAFSCVHPLDFPSSLKLGWEPVYMSYDWKTPTGATQQVQQVQRPLYRIYAKFRRVRRDFPTSSVTRGNSSGFVGFSLSQLVLLSRSSLHCDIVCEWPDDPTFYLSSRRRLSVITITAMTDKMMLLLRLESINNLLQHATWR